VNCSRAETPQESASCPVTFETMNARFAILRIVSLASASFHAGVTKVKLAGRAAGPLNDPHGR
jgi:hypothetical protein